MIEEIRNCNCDGAHCSLKHGEVRVYPLGAGGNLVLCHECFQYENAYRRFHKWRYGPEIKWDQAQRY